jgi:hypothetical protein
MLGSKKWVKRLKQPKKAKIHMCGAVFSTKKVQVPYLGDL